MFSRFERIVIALIFALLAAGVTLVIGQAQEGSPPAQSQAPDCAVCHTEFQMTWQNGPHGQAGSDPVFIEDWTNQGKPGACLVCHTTGYDPATATWESDSVSCVSCHGEAPADHPKSPMPVNRSPDLCGRCHTDTRFGWQDWQGSTHYQRGMNCTTCHDPHGNGNYRILRTVPTGSGGGGYAVPDTYPKAAANYATSNYLNMYFGANPANPMTEPPGAVAGQSILYDTSKWCSQCHTRYLAESGTNNPANPNPKPNSEGSRVDSGDAIYTFRHTSEGYGFSSFSQPAGFKYNNRACITCHASHGSNSSMTGAYSSTVEWPDGSIVNPPNDTQRASLLKMDNRGICRKCHVAQ